MRPEEVGVPRTTLVLGKHSGRHAVQTRCEEIGCALTRLEVDRVYRKMIALADEQKAISDADLARIVAEVRTEGFRPQAGGEVEYQAAAEAFTASEAGYGHGV
jgi:2-isopropylmalate synthase